MAKLETKILKNDGHTMQCEICYEMTRRAYKDSEEEEYWNDVFTGKLRPIKYKLILQVTKRVFDSWKVCIEPK
jgi:hypothetical protein